MTKDEALKLALEALESDHPDIQLSARITLRAVLAEPPLPVQREWVGLTDAETAECFEAKVISDRLKADAKRIETKLKGKNA